MKIIEAMKKVKDLMRKAEDIRDKIKNNCADLDSEKPAYGTVEEQTAQIASWLKMHSDILAEIERLRVAIQRTNLATSVSVEVSDGKHVTKDIASWIHRRRELAKLEARSWSLLTNRGLRAVPYKTSQQSEEVVVANVRRYYNQQKRDEAVERFTSEPSRIDAALEIVNATTELV